MHIHHRVARKQRLNSTIGLMLFVVLGASAVVGQEAVVHVRPDLLALFEEARRLKVPRVIDGIPDYTASAVAAQKEGLAAIRARLNALEPAGWALRDQVDYLLVRSELDMLDYGLHVYRPTSRSPNFYLSSISSFGLSSGATLSRLGQLVQQPPPFDADRTRRIVEHMRAIPRILDQARRNLTEPTREMSRWALPTLSAAGENSRRFAEGLAPHVPPAHVHDVTEAAAAMGRSLDGFRAWIEERLPSMPRAQPVGRELYDWMLRRIWLLPFDADDIRQLGEQEYGRYQSFTAFEAARNEGLPHLRGAATTAEYASLTQADEERIRRFLVQKQVITLPPEVGPYRRTLMPVYIQAFPLWAGLSGYSTPARAAVKYSVPEDHPYTSTYWEAIMRVDPSTNILHDGIPGHHFQGVVASLHPSAIRRQHTERVKSEGWSTYWEETAIQLGFYDDRPRSRELLYSFLRLRALRTIVDVRMALGEIDVEEATAALMSVPMDRRIASEEADDFFAAPTGGIVYQIGKLQIERLLGERRRQLGAQFDLKQFHDELVRAAWVPLELTRAEMTGRAELITALLADRSPLPSAP